MRRRALLSAAITSGSAIVAGCTSPGGFGASNAVAEVPTARLELATIPDAELPTKVLYTVRPAQGDDATAQLFDRILDGGASTQATRPPLPEGRQIAYDEGVYLLSREVIEETPATSYAVKVDVVTGSVNETAAIRFADLPEVDREQFASRGLADGDPVGIGTTFRYTDAERERSVLVPDSEYSYVTWDDGAEAEWVVDDAHDTTLYTYRYTAAQVATAADYGRRMRERFAFELAGLPEPQRDIVETAVADGAYVVGPDETPSDALVALADRFRGRTEARELDEDVDDGNDGEDGEGADDEGSEDTEADDEGSEDTEADDAGGDDPSGRYLVRYRGDVYWTTLVVRRDAFRTTTG